MASSGCPSRPRRSLPVLVLAALSACGAESSLRAPAAAPSASVVQQAGVDLPAGAGRAILLEKCLGCHDLGGLELFGAFYRRDDWQALVLTMQAHGAAIDAAEVATLTDYLARHFSPAD